MIKFVNATTYSQVISKELQEIGKEVNENGDLEKVMNISDSVITVCDELQKPAGENRKFASSLLDRMKKFRQPIVSGVKGLKPSISGGLKDALIPLLKEVSNLLVKFLASLIGAFFSFASWVRKIALEKKFTLNELVLELRSIEADVSMVGPVPIPQAKLIAPKLSAKFVPSN
jgi:hypothetical protein